MNIIFFDCDGVINSHAFLYDWLYGNGSSSASYDRFAKEYYNHPGEDGRSYDGYVVPELLGLFNALCEKTDAKIVWSSDWRKNFISDDDIRTAWKAYGFPVERYLDRTKEMHFCHSDYGTRGDEIRLWMEEHDSIIDRAVILDDNPYADRHVKDDRVKFCFVVDGITEENCKMSSDWLLKGKWK